MNKNTRSRLKIALKNYKKGNKSTSFTIPATMPNSSSLGSRTQIIEIGEQKRLSKKPKVANKSID